MILFRESSSWIFKWTFYKSKKVLYLSVKVLDFKRQVNKNFNQIISLYREVIYVFCSLSF